MAIGFPGQGFGLDRCLVDSFVNEEASAEIPFGVAVKGGTNPENQCKLLTAITDKLLGITVRSDSYQKGHELGDTGLKPGVVCRVARKGELLVTVEEAVTPASRVYVRAVVAGAEVAGAFRDTTDASDLIDVSAYCRFMGTTTGAGVVRLAFDFTMRGADFIAP